MEHHLAEGSDYSNCMDDVIMLGKISITITQWCVRTDCYSVKGKIEVTRKNNKIIFVTMAHVYNWQPQIIHTIPTAPLNTPL